MTLVAGAAAHGSPGVSTALQLVAALWSAGDVAVPVVVEADASGGVLAARYGVSLSPGFVTLAESLRKFESPPLLDHAQRLPSGVACVTISPSATAAGAQLRSAGPYLSPYLAASGHPVLLDAGTLLPDGRAVASVSAADLLLWFVRPTREELLVLRHRLAECPQPDEVALVLVGDTPYNADQVADALGVEVLHTLPVDPRGAAAVNLGGDDRFLRRSPLARSCTRLAELIHARVSGGAELPAESAEPVAPAGVAEPPEQADNEPEPVRAAADSAPFADDGLIVWTPEVTPEVAEPADPDLVVWVNDQAT